MTELSLIAEEIELVWSFCSLEAGDAVWFVVTFWRVWMDLEEQCNGHRLHFKWGTKWFYKLKKHQPIYLSFIVLEAKH